MLTYDHANRIDLNLRGIDVVVGMDAYATAQGKCTHLLRSAPADCRALETRDSMSRSRQRSIPFQGPSRVQPRLRVGKRWCPAPAWAS